MINQSIVQQRGDVTFPWFKGERVYMREFRKETGLPSDLRMRWQPTVDAMLEGVDTDGPIYLMIDQGVVAAGHAQRRPGMHIDGYWNPGLSAHGGGHTSERPEPQGHKSRQGHTSRPDKFYDEHVCPPGHRGRSGRHAGGRHSTHSGWEDCDFRSPEGIILASNVSACRALSGTFSGVVGEGGDCSHLSLSGMDEIILKPYTVYAGNVCMLHESLPVHRDVCRTLVRLNVPGWTPYG